LLPRIMAGYTIRGADGQPYGPVPLETLGAWIRERRVVAATEVCDGDGAFAPANSYPEIAALLLRGGRPEKAYPIPSTARIRPFAAMTEGLSIVRFRLPAVVACTASYLFGLLSLALPFSALGQIATRTLGTGWSGQAVAWSVATLQAAAIALLVTGVARCFLRLVDEEPGRFDDLFSGFGLARIVVPAAILFSIAQDAVLVPLQAWVTPTIEAIRPGLELLKAGKPWPPDLPWIPAAQSVGLVIACTTLLAPLSWAFEYLVADGAATNARDAVAGSLRLAFRNYPALVLLVVGLNLIVMAVACACTVAVALVIGIVATIGGAPTVIALAAPVSIVVLVPAIALGCAWILASLACAYRQVVPPGAAVRPPPAA
jgi:hypothetical protein